MIHTIPDPASWFLMLLMYLALGCMGVVIVVIIRWWKRRTDPLGLRHRPYSERLAGRFEKKRACSSKARARPKGGRRTK